MNEYKRNTIKEEKMKKYSLLLTALLLMFSTCICNAQTINNIYITNTLDKKRKAEALKNEQNKMSA